VTLSDTIQGLDAGCEETSSFIIDITNLSYLDTFFYVQNHNSCGHKLLVSPWRVNVSVCQANTNPISEVSEASSSTCESPGGASVSNKDNDGLTSNLPLLYRGEEGLQNIP
jgi:hypothetical protein